jgi:hypothetical protein
MASSAKFVQIMADDGSLYALDDTGRVWEFDGEEDRWVVLSEDRLDEGDN